MRSRRWTNQPPPGAVLSYPGLSSFFLFSAGGGPPRELTRGVVGTLSGSTPPTWGRADEAGGAALAFTNGASLTSYADFSTNALTQDLGLAPFTVIARAYWSGTNGNSGGLAERNDNNTVSAGWGFGVVNVAGQGSIVELAVEFATTNLRARGNTFNPNSNVWHTFAGTYAGNATVANSFTYLDGVPSQNGVSVNGSGAQTSDSANSFRIGNIDSIAANNGSWPGSIAWVAIFRRQLSHAEIALWSTGQRAYEQFAIRSRSVGAFVPADTPSPGRGANPGKGQGKGGPGSKALFGPNLMVTWDTFNTFGGN